MSVLRAFLRDQDGGPAAEFALVLPIALLFIFGIIDTGRYMWEYNQAEKATQTGARWAVATDAIPSEVENYSFAVSAGVLQGETVGPALFNGIECTNDGTITSCSCKSGGVCTLDATVVNPAAFPALVERMNDIKADITVANVKVDYDYSGLGFAGDPNGPDIAPLVTVSLRNMTFKPITTLIFDASIAMPDFSYTLTMEDGVGNFAN